MYKNILLGTVVLAAVLVIPSMSLGQSASPSPTVSVIVSPSPSPGVGPGLTPDSPLYFLKNWKEKIQLFFTFGAENKAKQYLHLADIRLAEYQKMIEKGKTEIAQKVLDKYEKQLDKAIRRVEEVKNKGKDVGDVLRKVEQSQENRLEVLQQNLQKVPEQARQGIQNAIDNSKTKMERFREKLGITPTPSPSPSSSPMVNKINLGKKLKTKKCNLKESYNCYEINELTKIVFLPNLPKRTETGFPVGDIILMKEGESKVLSQGLLLYDVGGEVYLTNIPNIFLIRTGWGDVGGGFLEDHYLDLNKEEIVLEITEITEGYRFSRIIIEKKGQSPITIEAMVQTDKCGKSFQNEKGKWVEGKWGEAQILDVTLNKKSAGLFKKPIQVNCLDEIEMVRYTPEFFVKTIGIEYDFSRVYFAFKLGNWQEDKFQPVSEKFFYIDFAHPSEIKIQQ